MIYHGHIKAGRIELNEPASLPEGAAVRVEVVRSQVEPSDNDDLTLGQQLLELSGIVKGMPRDGSQNHDHYIYGKSGRVE